MSTNLLIGTNRYQRGATHTATSTATGYSINDVATGPIANRWKANAAGTSHYIKYQLAAGQGGCNYFAVAQANRILADGWLPELIFATSDNNSDWTEFKDTDDLTYADLVGPNGEDYIYYDSAGVGDSTHIYQRLTIEHSRGYTPELSKLYCGTAFDIGRDPAGITIRRLRDGTARRKSVYEIDLLYADISYANALIFRSTIADVSSYHPVVLFTATNHAVLHNMKCIFGQVLNVAMPQRVTSRNEISFTFRELI